MAPFLFENEYIRQGILSENEYAPLLICPRTNAGYGMQVGDILREIAEATGWRQAQMAQKFRVGQGTISKWMSGQQTPNKKQWDAVVAVIRGDARLGHLRYEAETGIAPVMGRVGAGSIIEPDVEQTPPDGLYSITLPFPLPDDMIGFVVEGESMYPKYEAGEVIVVYKDQRYDTTNYLGQLVVVRTGDGRRYLKKLYKGSKLGLYRLESFNAEPIHDVEIAWVGEIFTVVPPSGVFRKEEPHKGRKPAATTRR